MTAYLRSRLGWLVAAAALVVMVAGLWPSGSTAPLDDAARAEAIAKNLRCPFCNGESIAEAPAAVARDLKAVIREQVAAGMTDDAIYAYFAARYGEQVLLDGPAVGWRLWLWLIPIGVLAVGVVAIAGLRRRERSGTDEPAVAVEAR